MLRAYSGGVALIPLERAIAASVRRFRRRRATDGVLRWPFDVLSVLEEHRVEVQGLSSVGPKNTIPTAGRSRQYVGLHRRDHGTELAQSDRAYRRPADRKGGWRRSMRSSCATGVVRSSRSMPGRLVAKPARQDLCRWRARMHTNIDSTSSGRCASLWDSLQGDLAVRSRWCSHAQRPVVRPTASSSASASTVSS